MSDLHHELARAAALAATVTPCWFCGAAAPARSDDLPPQCSDVAACFARSVSPPPGPEAHPTDCGACPESAPCGACARAYAEPDVGDNEEDETT